MKKLLLALVLSVVGLGAASASTLSWNYLQGDYAYQRNVSPSSGLNLQGSWGVAHNLYVVGSTTEFLGSSTHLNRTALGAGMFLPLNSKLDLYGQLQGVSETSNLPASTSVWGEAGEVGVRAEVLPSLELFSGLEYQHLNHSVVTTQPNEVFGLVGANYAVMHNLSVVGEFKASGQTKEAYAGLRFNF